MPNHNRAPKAFALFAGAGLALAACSSQGGEAAPSPSQTSHQETVPSQTFPKDAAHSAGCDGRISGFRDVTFTKDGEEYQITAIEGGTCASIYDNETSTHKLLGSVSVGTGIIAPCTMGADDSYIRILTSNAKQVDGHFTGEDFVGDVAATNGLAFPLDDCGDVPVNGFIIPA